MPLPNVHLISSSLEILSSEEGQLRRRALYSLARYVLQELIQFIPIVSEDPEPSPNNEYIKPLLSLPSTLFPSSGRSSSTAPELSSSIEIPPQPSPIIPILSSKAKILSLHLIEKGYLVRPITYPTVPKGKDRIRVCLHSGNRLEEVKGLVQELRKWSESQKMASEKGDREKRLPRDSKL